VNQRYSWGNDLADESGFYANVWQGHFPEINLGTDGFLFTSPVGYYGENSLGLTDMGGNVWEWCYNTYEPYKGSPIMFPVEETNKAVRGGSFMCDSASCHGYRVSHRNFTSSETSLFHTGFRCVADYK
jgi:formylglycine-generating enzyme